MKPLVSVVIASVSGLPALKGCLDALTSQRGDVSAEILVVERCGAEASGALAERFPEVRVIPAEAEASLLAMRSVGMRAASGQRIAVLGDGFRAAPGWVQKIEELHREGHAVVGGAVEKRRGLGVVDWAAFFCEYARFMPPVPRGPAVDIPGGNCVYDRRVLERLGLAGSEEVWESLLHRRMRSLGVVLISDPGLLVYHEKAFTYRGFLSQRYHYSRSFAAMRFAAAPWWKRLAFLSATPLLPGLVLARLAVSVARKGRHWGPFLLSLPVIATFAVSWAWGEAIGALFGPGASLKRVE